MRKFCAVVLPFFLIGAQTVRADGFLGLDKMVGDGSLEVLGQQANNETDFRGDANDHRGDTITRLRLGLNLPEIAENVSGRIEAVRNANGSGGASIQYGGTVRPTTLTATKTVTQIQNAYVDLKGFLFTDEVRLGRQYAGRKDDLLLYMGPTEDDAMHVTAFDAAVAKKAIGPVNVLAATGKLFEPSPSPGNNGATDAGHPNLDINLSYGILSADRLIPAIHLPLEVGYYQQSSGNSVVTSADNVVLDILDLRAGYGFLNDALWFNGEYAKNDGQTSGGTGRGPKFRGSAYVAKAAYDTRDKVFGLKALLANSTGEDQNNPSASFIRGFRDGLVGGNGASFSDFRFGEIFTESLNNGAPGAAIGHLGPNDNGIGGHPGLFAGPLGNASKGLNVIGAGVHYTPPVMDGKTSLKADYYKIKVNNVLVGADKSVGSEIDVSAGYRHSDTVSARVGYAVFSPGTGFASNFVPNPVNVVKDKITKLFAKITIQWGARPEDVSGFAYKDPTSRP